MSCCRDCSEPCCSDCGIGSIILPPFLTAFDIRRIRNSGMVDDEFFEECQNPITGNTVTTLKHTKGHDCMFLNKKEQGCSIFEIRPFDCRLFPLDITKIGNEYLWILYNHCCLPEDAVPTLLDSAKREILPYLMDDLPDYSTIPTELEARGNWRILEVLGSV